MVQSKILNIFILDDTPSDQKTITDFLTEFVFTKGEKINFILSSSLKQAKQQLSEIKTSFDLFVLDGTLDPEKLTFGFDLIPKIKETNPTVKIVMCSGNSELNYKGVAQGADMEIPKGEIAATMPSGRKQELAIELNELL